MSTITSIFRYINVVYELLNIPGNAESVNIMNLTVYGGVLNTVQLRYNMEKSDANYQECLAVYVVVLILLSLNLCNIQRE